jgi:tetratricopeptide (TPR) repeat protein
MGTKSITMNIDKGIELILKYYHEGNLVQAEKISRKILRKKPDTPDVLHLLGIIRYQLRDFDSGIKHIEKALHINPNLIEAYNNLGNIYQEIKQPEKAIQCYRKALQLDPFLAKTYYNLGIALQDTKQTDEAVSCYLKAIQLNTHTPGLYNNLGLAQQEKGQFDKAISSYKKALHIDQSFVEALYNLGNVFNELGQYYEAIHSYQKAIKLNPDYVEAHYNLSLVLLLTGDFRHGWEEYKWRWKLKDRETYRYSRPLWEGAVNDKTILLHAEQGFGDTVQFIRYAPLVAERCKNVIVKCQKELASLLQTVEGITQVFVKDDQLPEFDFHCPLLNLPSIFSTTISNIPSKAPYIACDSKSIAKWKDKLLQNGPGIKIGLVWSGNPKHKKDHKRSCSLEMFSPLADVDKATYYSLQKGKAATEADDPANGLKVINYTEDIHDFTDTAGFIENLDLIISVDTAVAHLAGALGKPVWTLLPYSPDWRWMLDREDSPWYPAMRLFRQTEPGNWDGVIQHVKESLKALLQ